MAAKNFTNFEERTLTSLNSNDYIVGYKSDASTEIRTTVQNITYVPYVEVTRTSTDPQQRTNLQEYLFEWDTKNFETNNTVLSGNQSNYNIVINKTGFYEVEARYSAFDLEEGDFMLLRLRGSTTPIINFTDNLLEHLDIRDTGTAASLNGVATTQGRTIIRVATIPYYLAISYIANGGSAEGGTAYYTQSTSTYANLPRIRVRRINNI